MRTFYSLALVIVVSGVAYLLWPRWTGSTLPDIGPGSRPGSPPASAASTVHGR